MIKQIIFILLLIFSNHILAQNFDYRLERVKFNQSMIESNQKGKIFTKKINDTERFEGKYLGKITIDSGAEFYIVNSSYVFDIKRLAKTENQIFIHDIKKQCVGYYYLSLMDQLPKKLMKNSLYFKVEGCKKSIIINFEKTIPQFINIKCDGQNDFYEFQFCTSR